MQIRVHFLTECENYNTNFGEDNGENYDERNWLVENLSKLVVCSPVRSAGSY